jgi:hypothetical protein
MKKLLLLALKQTYCLTIPLESFPLVFIQFPNSMGAVPSHTLTIKCKLLLPHKIFRHLGY